MDTKQNDNSIDLCVPIYLNQQIVFDLLAILEDGFTQISSITKSHRDSDTQSSDSNASIGLANVFAFLSVGVTKDDGSEKNAQNAEASTHQKIHTPTSLFSKLHHNLAEKKLIKVIHDIDDLNKVNSGDFVEFKAVLRKNPIVDIFEMLKQIAELSIVFSQGDKTQQKQSHQMTKKPNSPNEKLIQQLDVVLNDLKQSGSLEIIGEILDKKEIKSVLSTKIQYFNDQNAHDIIDGEFQVFGKAVRVIRNDSTDSINLLRKTSFGRLDSTLMQSFPQALDSAKAAGVNTPEFIVDIKGPTLQIIPIAIYS